MTGPGQVDAYSPSEVAARARDLGVAKVRQDSVSLFALALLAGAFISRGALLFTVVVTGSTLGFGATRLLGGVGFSLGLILVVVAGAELFTGNNLIAMAWASRLVTFREVLRSWAIVYAGNGIGALATVALVVVGRVHARRLPAGCRQRAHRLAPPVRVHGSPANRDAPDRASAIRRAGCGEVPHPGAFSSCAQSRTRYSDPLR